jgi:hypothetical protein
MILGDRELDLDDFDTEGLLDTNRGGLLGDPDRLPEGLLEIYLAEPLLSLVALRERFDVMLLLRDPPLTLSWSLFPSIASRSLLFLGPISLFSSRICRFCKRGRMMSHTRSSTRRASTNSSMNVRV